MKQRAEVTHAKTSPARSDFRFPDERTPQAARRQAPAREHVLTGALHRVKRWDYWRAIFSGNDPRLDAETQPRGRGADEKLPLPDCTS